MKTTVQQIAVTVVLLGALGPAVAYGGALDSAVRTLAASTVLAQTGEDARGAVDQLLARARQAMQRKDFASAEKLIAEAEGKDVRYGLFHLGDTPRKARRDLDEAKQQGDPSLPSEKFNPLAMFQNDEPPTEDPFVADRKPKELPTSPDQISHENAPDAHIGLEPERLAPVAGVEAAAQPPAAPQRQGLPSETQGAARSKSDRALLAARRFLSVGDTQSAREELERAKTLKVVYRFHEDSPAKVEAMIRKYEDVMGRRDGRQDTEAWQRQYSEVLMEQADSLLRWKQFDEAERLANDARRLNVNYGPFEATPAQLLQRIAQQRSSPAEPQAEAAPAAAGVQASAPQVKQQVLALVAQARTALAAGEVDQAERLAQQAEALEVPDSAYAQGEDRPWLVILDIQKARSQNSGVVNANHLAPAGPNTAQQALYNGRDDRTYNLPATAEEKLDAPQRLAQNDAPDAADAEGSLSAGERLFRQGEQALRDRDTEAALRYFTEAYEHEADLDPLTRQRLQDHLQLLAAPQPQAAPSTSLIEDAASRHRLMAHQLSAELSRQQIQSRKLQEKNPKQAMDLLQKARATVAASGVEPAAREQLLRRVDLSIAELEKYIEANRAQIELDEENKAVLDDIARRREAKLGVQQSLADLTEEFNMLREQQRFAEMEVVAKRAREMAPNEPIVIQLWQEAKNLRRLMAQQQFGDDKEEAVFSTLQSVEHASKPFDDRNPIIYPEAKEWARISDSRSRLARDSRSRRSERELEIERRLKTPVSLRFQERPLAEVMDHLARLAGVNIHLDPRGLGEEGVTSSTPVTIVLDNDISLKSALNLILEPLHLSYVITDEVLKITSEQLRDGEVFTQTYNVADLVIPIPNFVPGNHLGLQGQLSEAYNAMGYGGTAMNGPLAVLASKDGQGGAGKINPQLLAQMPGAMGLGGLGGGPPAVGSGNPILSGGPGGLGGGAQADFDALIELITATIQPNTWDEVGGPGSVKEFETNLSLVVSQTQDVHEEIVDLLEQLRRLQDLQVTIEVRFIRLNDSFFERIGIDFDFNIEDGTGLSQFEVASNEKISPSATVGLQLPSETNPFPAFTADLDIPFRQESFQLATPGFGSPVDVATFGFAILSDIEAYFLINASQGDRRSNILQAPKVTLFNGQQAFVSDTSQTPFVISVIPVVGDFAAAQQPVIVVLSEGTFLTIQAVVSNDRRYVRLTVVPFFSQIGEVEEFTFEGSSTTTASSEEDGLDDDGNPTDTSGSQTQTRSGTTVQLPTFSFVTVTTTVSVPDGGTVLLGGIKRLSESRNEFGVPLLSKLPYVDRLFRNVGIGRDTESLMMMVTPRIIIQEEEEERLGITQ